MLSELQSAGMREEAKKSPQAVYAFVRRYIDEQGYPPSLAEIADQCGLGLGTVVRHLNRLEVQGRVVRAHGKSRSIRLASTAPGGKQPSASPTCLSDLPTTEAISIFLRDYIRQWGFSPSVREVAAGVRVSTTAVMYHLKKLRAQGRVASVPGKARTLRILK